MVQNEKISEKSLRKAPENDKVRHHLLSKLTAKINLINYEVKGHKANIQMHKDQIDVLTGLIAHRETNLDKYNERKKYLLEYVFSEPETIIVESVEPEEEPQPDKKEKKDTKTDKFLSLLEKKGINFDDVITQLEKEDE